LAESRARLEDGTLVVDVPAFGVVTVRVG
jgi:hypothetical protein